MLKLIGRILKLSGEYRPKLIRALVLSFFEALFANVPVFLLMYVLWTVIEGSFGIRTIWIAAAAIVGGIVLRMLCRYFTDVNQSGMGYEIFARERMQVGDRIKRFPMGYFSEGNVGNVTAVITNDISFVEEYGMMTLGQITSSLMGALIGIIFLAIFNVWAALVTLAVCLLSYLALNRLHKVASKGGREMQDVQKDLAGTVIEYIKGMPVIKAFNLVGSSHKATTEDFSRTTETLLRFEKSFVWPMITVQVITGLGVAAFAAIAGWQGITGSLELPFLIAFSVFAFEMFVPFLVIAGVTGQFRVMEAALDRYEAVLKTAIIDEDGKDIQLERFSVEFDNVTFGYDDADVLKNISFSVPEHSMTALVGKSGCGKTTIANLVARFWDVQGGSVRIGGIDVRRMSCDSLLKNISMVFQNVYLFNDTVYNNVVFGKPQATKEQVEEACKKARCHEFIMQLPEGYDTVIGEGGSTLSGGEKQRISIARAILKDAPIVLLDEATASIDPDNEAYIQQAISEMVKGKTLIVIAHKLTSILGADQILMIEDGEIVEHGTHAELLGNEGAYARLWERRTKSRSWSMAKA